MAELLISSISGGRWWRWLEVVLITVLVAVLVVADYLTPLVLEHHIRLPWVGGRWSTIFQATVNRSYPKNSRIWFKGQIIQCLDCLHQLVLPAVVVVKIGVLDHQPCMIPPNSCSYSYEWRIWWWRHIWSWKFSRKWRKLLRWKPTAYGNDGGRKDDTQSAGFSSGGGGGTGTVGGTWISNRWWYWW